MSHFGVLVLADHEVDRASAEDYCVGALARYDENLEVEEHEEDCHCVGWEAKMAARKEVEPKFAPERERLRSEYQALRQEVIEAGNGEVSNRDLPIFDGSAVAVLPDSETKAKLAEHEAALDIEWKALFEGYEVELKQAEKAHPMYGKPDPHCDTDDGCGGTGRRRTTGNPQGYWDWWVVGGRWTGALVPEYDPGADPRNFGTCQICGGSGKRWWRTEVQATAPEDPLGMLSADPDPETGLYTRHLPAEKDDPQAEESPCNGCDGTGIERHWHDAEIDGDVQPISNLPEGYNKSFYALVTPDGEWHQRGRMGWWGMSHDDMDNDTWHAYVKDVVEKVHQDCPNGTAIVVDCHV